MSNYPKSGLAKEDQQKVFVYRGYGDWTPEATDIFDFEGDMEVKDRMKFFGFKNHNWVTSYKNVPKLEFDHFIDIWHRADGKYLVEVQGPSEDYRWYLCRNQFELLKLHELCLPYRIFFNEVVEQ